MGGPRAWRWVLAAALAGAAVPAWAGGGPPAKPPAPVPAAGGTVSGSVTDEDDKPLAGATVKVTGPDGKTLGTATSDAKGFYAVRGLPAGKAGVEVRAKGRVVVHHQVTVPSSGLALADAQLVPGVRYTGRVLDGRGMPVADVRITATETRDSGWWFSFTAGDAASGKDGSFVVDGLRPSGKYTLTFRHPRYLDLELPGLNAEAGRGVSDLEAILDDAAWVKGTVVDAAGKPVAGARVVAPGERGGMRTFEIDGVEITVFMGDFGDSDRAKTDAQGRFEIGGLKPTGEDDEPLLLRVRAQGFFPAELKIDRLEPGRERGGLVVTLEPGTAVVEGVVRDDRDQPVKGATVVARAPREGELATAKTDAAGRFRLERVATKEAVHLHASAEGHEDGDAGDVALGTKDAKLSLRRTGRLRVRVLGADGKPLARVRVVTAVEAGRGKRHESHDLAQGAGGVEVSLPLGSVEATVSAPDHDPETVGDWEVEPGQVIDAGEVRLEKAAPKDEKGKAGEEPDEAPDEEGGDEGDDGE